MANSITVYVLGSFFLYCVIVYIRRALQPGLRLVPGPFLARFSGLYRLYMSCSGEGPRIYRSLHEKHGKLVRVGWNHVSVSDPTMIPIIYGAGSKYMKVSNSPPTNRDRPWDEEKLTTA
ncbi:uncharacterized protein A1O9_00527 [Exophiala aquamarina CBS 119918]|uniref:Cytochrome P450 oxidoreductase n=1 Tax=Exophiala aquamarina CBS 119918 TaxID=1182545 RepID=A0A072PR06_9EURO|nr:uncharacterized protein A1O9_00527 [Exophiala aquamarina CBS 119918]KEF62554.1 hypothetical protein A1O9_00527 [Exophiala aquamarina CBS 119918]